MAKYNRNIIKISIIIFILFLNINLASSNKNLNVSDVILINNDFVKEQIVNVTQDDVLILRTDIHYKDGYVPKNDNFNTNIQYSSSNSDCYLLETHVAEGTKSYVINPNIYKANSFTDQNSFISIVSKSAETWDDATTQEIFNPYIIDTNSNPSIYDINPGTKNTVIFEYIDPFLFPNVLALAHTWSWSNSGKIAHFDIIINSDPYIYWGDASTSPDVYDLQGVITHEFGHTFGLGDLYNSKCSDQTMYGRSGRGETVQRTLKYGDLLGLDIIYPSSTLSSIEIIPAITSIISGNSQQFVTSNRDQFGNLVSANIVWSSTNLNVGTITKEGLFTALNVGTTTITATSGLVSKSMFINVVSNIPSTIIVLPSHDVLSIWQVEYFKAYIYDTNNNVINVVPRWSSSNTTVGIIDNNGIFVALSNGTTTISAILGEISGRSYVIVGISDIPGDTNNNGIIEDLELLAYIQMWTEGNVNDINLLSAIEIWSQ